MRLRLLPLAITASLAAAACSKEVPPPAPPRPVITVVATPGAGKEMDVYSGEVRARREADLGFRVAGKIVARYVDVGATVKKGAVLARLDPSDAQLNVAASKAAVAAAETEFNFARAELERYRSLLEKKFISEAVYDQKQNAFNATAARLEQARSQLSVTQNQSGYTALAADQDGVITAVNAEAGQVVSAGQPVMRLARPEEKEVLINVPETRLDAFKSPEREVLVRILATPDKVYRGRVREVAPNADPTTRTFATRVTIIDAEPGVALGMTANVAMAGGSAGGILLPLTALYQADGKPVVWVVDAASSSVRQRPVTIGQYRENGVVVASGLEGGERVVTAGVNKLVEGQQVALAPATTESAQP
ncbi:MAG: efflux RND transporter periplasmic adaptor subunit [Burkholderiales bacterium]